MKTAEIKVDLHNKIENAATEQLKELYGLITNYFNSSQSDEVGIVIRSSKEKNHTVTSRQMLV